MNQIIGMVVQPKCTPVELQERIRKETGASLYITHARKIMHQYDLSPKRPQRAHINRASKKAVQNWQYHLKK